MFASAEDVIIHKLFAGRPRDLEDVRSILIKKPEVDAGYIVRWLAQFDQAVPGGALFKPSNSCAQLAASPGLEGLATAKRRPHPTGTRRTSPSLALPAIYC